MQPFCAWQYIVTLFKIFCCDMLIQDNDVFIYLSESDSHSELAQQQSSEVCSRIEDTDDDVASTSADLFHPSIAKFPRKMTELFLMGKQPRTSKSVDEFMTEIPLGKKKKRTGRRRLNELTDEQRHIMGEVNLCYVRKDFDQAWNLCEDLIKTGNP